MSSSLTVDTCGGPNPLVGLSQQFQSSQNSGYRYHTEAGPSSHSIANILHEVKLNDTEKHVKQVGHTGLHNNWQKEFSENYRLKRPSFAQEFPPAVRIQDPTTIISNEEMAKSSAKEPTLREPRRTFLNTTFQQQSPTSTKYVSKSQLYNRAFEEWIMRYYPEVKIEEKKDQESEVNLSKELAEEWLKDLDLNEVLNVNSLAEAEQTIQEWIKEFTLGQTFSSRPNYDELLRAEDNYKDYQYMLESTTEERDLDEGIALLRAGDLSRAIAVFETLTRCNVNGEVVSDEVVSGEAWYYLGLSHQHAEREDYAIAAFRRVPESHVCYPSTLMSLSASYYNERKIALATTSLARWIEIKGNSAERAVSAGDVRERFLDLAHRSNMQDVQLQTGMGILSCILEEHDKAVDCFKVAVSQCPDDHLLWNRLGATLANDDRCSEAVPAYHRALALCPGYVRARYNLGVACINLGAHREGIKHMITGLCLQSSDTMWSTLRLALCLGNFYQYLPAVDDRNLDHLAKEFNIT